MEEQAAKLLATLNAAIETGMDNLPVGAEIAMSAIGAYGGARVVASLAAAGVAFGAAVLALALGIRGFRCIRDSDSLGGDGWFALGIISSCFGVLASVVGVTMLLSCLNWLALWVSPLGWVLMKALG